MPLEAELVEERLLATVRSPIISHSPDPRSRQLNQTGVTTASAEFFNTIDPFLLGWTAPSGIAMCQGEVVAELTKGSRP